MQFLSPGLLFAQVWCVKPERSKYQTKTQESARCYIAKHASACVCWQIAPNLQILQASTAALRERFSAKGVMSIETCFFSIPLAVVVMMMTTFLVISIDVGENGHAQAARKLHPTLACPSYLEMAKAHSLRGATHPLHHIPIYFVSDTASEATA
jgi:hypothetical protein